MIGTVANQLISIYKGSKANKVPEPPVEVLAAVANKITGTEIDKSKQLATPDAVIMLLNYGLTTWLARGGNQRRNKLAPAIPIFMGLKTIADSAIAFKIAQEEWKENKEVRAYSQTAMVTAFASAVVAVPEMVKAIRVLVNRNNGEKESASSNGKSKAKKQQSVSLAAN